MSLTREWMRQAIFVGAVALALLVAATPVRGQRSGAAPGEANSTPKAAAPVDFTGYWVSLVTEDWRYRMVTPAKGDYQGVPMTPEAVKAADAWDPAADEAAGNQCKSYGAAGIMRVPGRIHVTWQDDTTLRVDTDAGSQTRLLRFGPSASGPGEASSWQGRSTAEWQLPGGRGRAGGPGGAGGTGGAKTGSLKVLTTNMRAGYLRKNGVPYSEAAILTEYFDLAPQRNGDVLLVVTAVVEDSKFLRQPFIVSSQLKKLPNASGWDPTPCSSTW